MEEKTTILVVDDNHENLRVVSNYLKDKGYKLALALNAREALVILNRISVDLILMDVMMPETDGFTACKMIKENEKLSDIPVVFLTAKTQTEDIVEGFEAGGVDYITKPFNREELLVRVRNHVELSKARKKIIEMNKTRDKLYSIIAHDIKSPFSTIIFTISTINEGLFDPSKQEFRDIMRDLEISAKETKNLIDNLLEWTKFRDGHDLINPKESNIAVVAAECILLLNTSAKNKKITLTSEVPADLTGWFDEVSMHTVLRNLISNSLKFTNEGGAISLSGSRVNDDKIMVMIKDTGIGMSDQVRKKLFESRETFTTIGTNNERGTGLGLTMVLDFVEKNGGSLQAASEPGKGTEISILLPAHKN